MSTGFCFHVMLREPQARCANDKNDSAEQWHKSDAHTPRGLPRPVSLHA